jgi:hypothetical protein
MSESRILFAMQSRISKSEGSSDEVTSLAALSAHSAMFEMCRYDNADASYPSNVLEGTGDKPALFSRRWHVRTYEQKQYAYLGRNQSCAACVHMGPRGCCQRSTSRAEVVYEA